MSKGSTATRNVYLTFGIVFIAVTLLMVLTPRVHAQTCTIGVVKGVSIGSVYCGDNCWGEKKKMVLTSEEVDCDELSCGECSECGEPREVSVTLYEYYDCRGCGSGITKEDDPYTTDETTVEGCICVDCLREETDVRYEL